MPEGIPCKTGDRFQAKFCLTCDLPECVPMNRTKCPIKNGQFDEIQQSYFKSLKNIEIPEQHFRRLKKMKYIKRGKENG